MSKQGFWFVSKTVRMQEDAHGSVRVVDVVYEADFWEGPEAPGETGRYVRRRCSDTLIGGRFLNTAPNVSYYGALLKAAA